MTKYKVKHLRKRYAEAVEKKEEQFEIGGFEFLTSYAKYMLQYFDQIKLSDDHFLDNVLRKADDSDAIFFKG